MAESRATNALARDAGHAAAAGPAQAKRYRARGLPLGNPRVLASVAALAATTAAAGIVLPATVWAPALHLGIVFLGLWLARPRDVYILATLASVLVLAGPFLAQLGPGASPGELARAWSPGPALANPLMVLLAIWALAAAIAGSLRREAALRARLAQDAIRREDDARALARLQAERRPAPLSARLGDEKDPGHEIRTLLNAIVGFSEAAKQEIFGPHADPRYRDYMGHINDSGWALLRAFERQTPSEPMPERHAEPGARRPRGGGDEHGATQESGDADADPGASTARAVNQ